MPTATWPSTGEALDDISLPDGAVSAPSSTVPATLPIAIGGHAYKVEVDKLVRRTLVSTRQSFDQSSTPGEQSRSTEGFWTRGQRRWLYGSGQTAFDPFDLGVDNLITRQRWLNNWNCEPDEDNREGLSMLRRAATTISQSLITPFGPGLSVAAGAYNYIRANNNIYRVSASGATVCTGFGTDLPECVASDGYTVWAAAYVDSTHAKLYSLTTGGTAFTVLSAGSQVFNTNKIPLRLFYGNGFLFAGCQDEIRYYDKTGAISAVVDTISPVSNGNPQIVSISCSTTTWYFAMQLPGLAPSPIYKLSIDSTGAFGKASVACPTFGPTEVVNCVKVIGSVILIGTNRGFRLGTLDSSGNISAGPLNAVVSSDTVATSAFAGVNEFAQFGTQVVASYVSASEPYSANVAASFKGGNPLTGTIMIDISLFPDALQPAWWYWWRSGVETLSDCFIGEHQTTPIVYERNHADVLGTTNLISPCSFVTSWVSFSTDAKKTFVDIDLIHDPLATGDTIAVYYQAEDETTWNLAGVSQQVGTIRNPDRFPVRVSSRLMRFAFVMTAGSVAQVTTPRIRRWEVRGYAGWPRTDEILIPVILHDRVDVGEQELVQALVDTRAEYKYLKSLVESGAVVLYQMGSDTEQVRVDQIELQPAMWSMNPGTGAYSFYQGIAIVRLLTI